MDHLIIIYLLLCGCGCGCWAIWRPSPAPPRPRYRGPPLEVRPPVWKDPPTQPNEWLVPLGAYCVLQLVVLITMSMTGERWEFAILTWFTGLVLVVAFRRHEVTSWWRAWNERGEEVDVEVPPAPIAKA